MSRPLALLLLLVAAALVVLLFVVVVPGDPAGENLQGPGAQDVGVGAPSAEEVERGGDGDARDGAPPPASTQCLPWGESLEEGLRLARETGRLMLVYVCPSATSCPAGDEFDRRILTPEAGALLGTRCVPVHVFLDGKSQGEDRDVLERLSFEITPALGIVSADGDVLQRQYARLYSAYDFKSSVLPGDWDATLTVEEIVQMLADAAVRYTQERKRLRELRARKDADARTAHAAILAGWGRTDEALHILAAVAETGAHPQAGPALARLLERRGRTDEAAEVLERAARAHGDQAEVERWRSDAARLRLQAAADDGSAASSVQILRRLASDAVSTRVRILSRLALAEFHARTGEKVALRADRAWLDEIVGREQRAPQAWSADMLLRLVGLSMQPDLALLERAERYLNLLMRTYPRSISAQKVKHGLFGHLKQMRQMAAGVPPGAPGDG